MTSAPVACTLDPAALAERRALLASLTGGVRERRELADGVSLRFAGDRGVLADISRLIELERSCCPFLRFRLTVEPDGGPIWLELTGPEGTSAFLNDLL